MKKHILILMVSVYAFAKAQTPINQTLTFEEYIGYVKKYHPVLKQANLVLSAAEAKRLKARGGFDPKVEVDYDRKKFKNITYYDQLNVAFKIPTWYGIEFKANFEENSGEFLNPNLSVPDGGLYSAGVSFSLAQGFLINERMAMLKQSKYFLQQSEAKRELLINTIISEASNAYFEWLAATKEQYTFTQFKANANTRFEGVKKSALLGDKAIIDTVEAKITIQDRALQLEAAKLKRTKAALIVSNFLWIDDVPVQLENTMQPEDITIEQLKNIFALDELNSAENAISNHPKIKAINAKIKGLTVDRKLKSNKLLPKVNLQYNFINQTPEAIEKYNTNNYKAGLTISMPIFLRKERGDLKLAKFKVRDALYDLQLQQLSIANKIQATLTEVTSLAQQNNMISGMVTNYSTLLNAENRKFSLGESSLFLINSREQKLISATLKAIELKLKEHKSIIKYYNTLGKAI